MSIDDSAEYRVPTTEGFVKRNKKGHVSLNLLDNWSLYVRSYLFLAEKFLESVEGNQNYPLLLLKLLDKSEVDQHIRVSSAITFKNYVKRNWRVVRCFLSSFLKVTFCLFLVESSRDSLGILNFPKGLFVIDR